MSVTVLIAAARQTKYRHWAILGWLASPFLLKESYQEGCDTWKILDLDLLTEDVRSFAKSVLRGQWRG